MTTLLQQAFAAAAALPATEQDLLAARLLAEVAEETEPAPPDRGLLSRMAVEALAEHQAGLSEPLDPDSR